jgi:hypothetical protein
VSNVIKTEAGRWKSEVVHRKQLRTSDNKAGSRKPEVGSSTLKTTSDF